MAKWCQPDERASGSERIQDHIGRASDNVAFCPGQTGVAPLRVTPPAPVQNERYRTPAILDFRWRLATSVRDNVSIRDREGRPLRGPVVGQQSASHADSSVRVVPAKIKSRIQIRRADKIELKMAIGFRRKSLLLNILIIKNIYRFSRES
jgi:hypothetical protein